MVALAKPPNENQSAKWLRRIARGVGSLVAGFWLFVGIVSLISDPNQWGPESAIMACLIIASAAGIAIAWWREGIGGISVIGCAIAHSTFAYIAFGHNHELAMLIAGGPFLVVGTMFIASWRFNMSVKAGM